MGLTIPQLIREKALLHPETAAQRSKDSAGNFQPISFRQLNENILDCAAGLRSIGIVRGDKIGLISENRKEWLQASNGIMALGCADVPRGCDASAKELDYILSFSECPVAFLEHGRLLSKIIPAKANLPLLKKLVFFDVLKDDEKESAENAGFTVLAFADLITAGQAFRSAHPSEIETERDNGSDEEIATIIYTSGTTGEPKGVMLLHRNFTAQLPDLNRRIAMYQDESALCVLPVWHAYQRACEYVMLNAGTAVCYSKPISQIMLPDFKKVNPVLIPTVPRIWESIYDALWRKMRKSGGVVFAMFQFFVAIAKLQSRLVRQINGRRPLFHAFGLPQMIANALLCAIPLAIFTPLKALGNVLVFKKIREMLGTNFRLGISGGGALPPYIDEFFWAIGIPILEGYGLTETAPILAVREFYNQIFGTIGTPLDCCEIKIIDDSGRELPCGQIGSVIVKGGQVMKGYYNRPDLTRKSISEDGWFDTGDLGMKTFRGEIMLRGRKKDTIVLMGGENVEPVPIEMKLSESRYIANAVVVGQDKKFLAALIVPSKEDITQFATENGITTTSYEALLKESAVIKCVEAEVSALICGKNGFKAFERICGVALLSKPFEVGVELSAKQDIMRFKLNMLYKKEIESLFV